MRRAWPKARVRRQSELEQVCQTDVGERRDRERGSFERMIAYAEDSHAGAQGRFHADLAVLDDEAPGGLDG